MTPGGLDLVGRLRRSGEFLREVCATTFDDDKKNGGSLYREAADEIERLRGALASVKLRAVSLADAQVLALEALGPRDDVHTRAGS